MSKYVVGEGIVVTGGGNGTPAGAPTGTQAADGATNNGVAPPPPAQSTSTGPLLVSVGVGPALDLRDAHVHADLSDYILASSYGETFLRCGRAEGMARSRSAEMLSFFQADFAQFTVLMHLMDWMPEVSHALAAWRTWHVSAAQRNDEQDATAASAAARASPSSSSVSEERLQRLGRRMGLEGHAVVAIQVPEEHLRGAGSRSHAPAHNGSGTVLREVRIPYIGARPFFHALWLLGRLDGEARPKAKLALLAQVRAVLLTTLSSGSFTELSCSSTVGDGSSKEGAHGGGGGDHPVATSFDSAHSDPAEIRARMMALCQSSSLPDVTAPSQRLSFAHPLSAASLAPVAPDEVAQGSVEDFMTVLCFLVLVASSPSFGGDGTSGGGGTGSGGGASLLSHLHFLRLLFPAGWGRSKAAVDCLVACKYLMGLWDSLSPLLAAEKAEADAKSQAMAREQQEATRRREQRMQEEQALRQQALELSRQIQDVDSQRAAAEQQQLHQQQQQQKQPEQHAPAPTVHVQPDSVVVLPSSAPDVTSIGVEPMSLLSPGSGVLLPAAVAAAVDEVVAGGAGLFPTAAAAEDTFSASDAYQQMLSAARAQAMAQQQQQPLPPAEVQFPQALPEDAHTAPSTAQH
jgi:hypothetical protein